MSERPLNRQQRRALERQDRKSSPTGLPQRNQVSSLSLEERTTLDPIKRQMATLSDRNRDMSVSELSEEDRVQATILAAQLYRVFHPSRLSVAELSGAVDFSFIQESAPTDRIQGIDAGLAGQEHVGGILDPHTGRIQMWLSTEVLQADYLRTGPSIMRRFFTPISIFMQMLTHEYLHKAALSHGDTGFYYYPHFNEIATEDLSVRMWKRAGYVPFSGYPLITDRLELLDFVLQRANIGEQEFAQLYFDQDITGLASRFVSPRRVDTDKEDVSDQEVSLVRRGYEVIKAIEQKDQQFLSRFFNSTPRR